MPRRAMESMSRIALVQRPRDMIGGAHRVAAMDIHHIRYFLAVCETRNFTRAAEKCNVTQPALSRAIQQLEDEVGGLLFRRERNLTHITDLGALLQAALPAGARRAVRRAPGSLALPLPERRPPQGRHHVHDRAAPLHRPADRLQHAPQGHPAAAGRGRAGPAVAACWRPARSMSPSCRRASSFPERFDVTPLFRERFMLAFPPGHRLAQLRCRADRGDRRRDLSAAASIANTGTTCRTSATRGA